MITRILTRRNLSQILCTLHVARVATLSRPKNIPKVLLFTSSYPFAKASTRDKMDNFDLKLKEACERGESAVLELMNFLKTSVVEISKAYKESMKKQIEIIDAATKAGATSSKWDELPEFRSAADDLKRQFNEFVATINILGQLAHSKTLEYITKQEKQFKLLAEQHKELDKIIQKQVQEMKVLEDKLLAKNKDNIEKTK